MVLGVVLVTDIGADDKSSDAKPISVQEKYAADKASMFENYEVIVLSDVEDDVPWTYIGNNIRMQETFLNVEKNDVIVIDGLWAQTQDRNDLVESTRALINDKHPVIFLGFNIDFVYECMDGLSTGYGTGAAEAYGSFYDEEGFTDCWSVSGFDAENTVFESYKWARSCIEHVPWF